MSTAPACNPIESLPDLNLPTRDGGEMLLDILGLDGKPEDLVGRLLKDVLIYTDTEGAIRHALEERGEIRGFEYHFKTLKEEDRWGIPDSFLITEPDARQRIVEAIVMDVTERKMAERRLAAEKARLRMALCSIGDSVTATGTGGNVVLVFRGVSGFKKTEEESKAYRLHLEALVEERTAELKQANAQLAQAEEDRTRAVTALEQSASELQRSNRELEQFAYVASHDLQEPLRKVASFTQLLAERYGDRLDGDAKKFIAFAVDGAHRMQGMISDLLAYSRVGTRGSPFAPVDGEAILHHAMGNLELAIRESGAVVTHTPLPTITGDAEQLVQLFQNLIGNAIKFRREPPPQVHVCATRQGPEWIFRVSDNGIGIDPQYFDRLFVIFQRLHSRAEYPGSGIGLAISRKVVERHHGRIWVESEVGKGSIFCFSLPSP